MALRASCQQGARGRTVSCTRSDCLNKGIELRRVSSAGAGLLAWIVEKFRAWSDCGGDVESRFTKDELLTNVAI